MATRQAVPNVKRFRELKNRVSEFYEFNGDAIRAKKTVMAASIVFTEMDYLVEEINRLSDGDLGEDEERYHKVSRFVRRVCGEQANAIKTGQFMKVSAEIFGAYRFLVRLLEKTIISIVDPDEALELRVDALKEEAPGRISLDLEQGITDPADAEPDEPEGPESEKKGRAKAKAK